MDDLKAPVAAGPLKRMTFAFDSWEHVVEGQGVENRLGAAANVLGFRATPMAARWCHCRGALA